MQKFGDQKQQQLHAGIFGVIAADQFLFGLGQIEWQPRASAVAAITNTKNPSGCKNTSIRRFGLLADDGVELERPASSTTPSKPSPSGIS